MTSQNSIKLYLYEHQPTKTMIDVFEADDYGDFLLVKIAKEMEHNTEFIEQMKEAFKDEAGKKKIIIFSDDAKFTLYGVAKEEQDDDSRSISGEL